MPNAMRLPLESHTPARPLPEAWSRHTLTGMVADSVRQVRRSACGLTTKDHALLKQFVRGDYLTGVLRLVELGQKCEDVTDATAFAEALRGFTVQHHPKAHICVMDAFGAESHSNGEFDAAQIAFAADPSEENCQRAIEAGNRQLVETHRSLIALHRARTNRARRV